MVSRSVNDSNGFTLIELLVVVTIIALLSSIGLLHYGNLQRKARDVVRKTYIEQVAKAFEVNKEAESYTPLQTEQFTALSSFDPMGWAYCVAPGSLPDPSFSVSWEGTCPAGFEVIAAGAPTTSPFTSFKVCTYLEQPGPSGTNVFCKPGTL